MVRPSAGLSRLMQNPLGAAFARKVLRCKARDEGRTLALFDESRNAAAGHFSCKPFGAVLGGARRSGRAKATAQRRRAIDRAPRPCFAPSTARAITCFVASLANSHAIRLRLASRISPRQAAPRSHGVLHQPARVEYDVTSDSQSCISFDGAQRGGIEAAVDIQNFAGNSACKVGEQKRRRVAHVFNGGVAPQRRMLGVIAEEFP